MAYIDVVNGLNPIAYWRLGETTGTTASDETGNYNGIYVGSPTLNDTGLLSNDNNSSVIFNGSNNYIHVIDSAIPGGSLANIGETDSGYSVAFLFKTSATTTSSSYWINDDTIIEFRRQKGISTQVPFSIGMESNKLHVGAEGEASEIIDISTSNDMNDGAIHHAVATFSNVSNSLTAKLYVDGFLIVEQTQTVSDQSLDGVTSNLVIGARSQDAGGISNFFNGNIDEVAILPYELTQTEIAKLYIYAKDLPVKNDYKTTVNDLLPIAYWRLGESSGTTAIDETGNYNTSMSSDFTGGVGLLVDDNDTSYTFVNGQHGGTVALSETVKSISLLYKLNSSVSSYSTLLSLCGTGNGDRAVFGTGGNTGNFPHFDNSPGVSINAAGLGYGSDTTNAHHIVVTYDDTDSILYIDGVEVDRDTGNIFGVNYTDFMFTDYRYNGGNENKGFPGIIDEMKLFNTSLTQDQVFALYASSIGVKLTQQIQKLISGTITESLAITEWIIRAYNLSTGALTVESSSTDGTFSLNMTEAGDPDSAHCVTVLPNQGTVWYPSTAYILDDLIFPTDPISKPYYYKCTTAGTTDSAEPTWPVSGTINDGSAIWEMVEGLVQPQTHSPLFATQQA